MKTGDKIFGYRNRQPEVTPIESPTGVDLHPHPEDPVRVSKRAGLAILTIVILLLIAFAYGGYRRTQKVQASSRETGIPKSLAPATAASKEFTAEIPAGSSPMARRNLPRQETANGTPMLTPPDDLPRAGQRSQRASPQRAAVLQAQPAQISHETTLEERRVLAAYQREQEAILAPTGIREGAGTATTWNQSANQRPRVLEDAARNTTLPQTINAGGSSIDSDEPAMAALLAQHEGNSEYDVQNMQTRKQSFINGSRAQRSADYLPSTRTAPLSKFEIKAGWEIPAVLEQGLNSDLPGELKALVTSNVYDTGTGLYLLIPQGSRLIGKYDSRVSYGQDGVQVAWDRIIFPDASSVDLNGMVGLDAHGNAGLRDKVDRHYKRLLGFSALTSLFTAAFDVSQRRNQSALNYPSPTETAASAVGRDISETGASITRRNLNVQPTIKVPVGYKFTVRVNRDIVFDAPYELIGSDARRTTVPPRRLLQ